MSKNGFTNKIYCAQYTITLKDTKIDNCAFISAASAEEAWNLTQKLASIWNVEEENANSLFKIQKIYKRPCSKIPHIIWSKKVLSKIKKKIGSEI
ncbi:MAG: hypothetical protein ACXACK_14650 [Candidatus Hodarchaeales archaeon]|jgi:hypothetical protein